MNFECACWYSVGLWNIDFFLLKNEQFNCPELIAQKRLKNKYFKFRESRGGSLNITSYAGSGFWIVDSAVVSHKQ